MPPSEEKDAKPAFDKDSIANTFITAALVCLACSLFISVAHVALKNMQDLNVELDKKKNILSVAGFSEEDIARKGIKELFDERVTSEMISLETGAPVSEEEVSDALAAMKIPSFEDAMTSYDWIAASKVDDDACRIKFEDKKDDIAGLKAREKYSFVYRVMDESGDNVEKFVFPVRGYGLWSTLKGFLAVEPDFQTIAGLTYYEHAETPGLGGEVDNPTWKKKWKDKKIFEESGDVKITVVKGSAGQDPYAVDGLSGATITSNGVTNMLKYWLGPSGFGKFIDRQKSGSNSAATGNANNSGGSNG